MGKAKVFGIIDQYGFFLLTMACTLMASAWPNSGGSKDLVKARGSLSPSRLLSSHALSILCVFLARQQRSPRLNGHLMIWYFAIPLTYLEAGLCCSTTQLLFALRNGYPLLFILLFIYIVMPITAKLVSFLLSYANVNGWLLKGIEVFYCMPPPLNTSLVFSRLNQTDLPTSIIFTLICHFVRLFLSPVLVYFMLGTSSPPLVGINIQEILYGTIIPLGVGISLRSLLPVLAREFGNKTSWISQACLLLTTYHVFCDAISMDATAVGSIDILLCVLIACLTQMCLTYLCWILCSRWLTRNMLLSTIFTSMHKSSALGSWLFRGAYHGLEHGPMINLPLVILPMAQLILGSLVASYLAPQHKI